MKTIKKIINNFWTQYTYSLQDHVILTDELIREAITNFFENRVNKISDSEHIIVMFRINTINDHIYTIGNLQKISKNDLDYYIQYITNVLYFKSDEYKEEIVKEFIFSFGVRAGAIAEHNRMDYLNDKHKPVYQSYKNYKLPATIDPIKYGKLIVSYYDQDNLQHFIIQITPLTIAKIKHTYLDKNEVEIIKDGMTVLKYTDHYLDQDKFKRVMGNGDATFYFTRSGEFELFTIWKPSRFIKRKRSNKKLDSKIVTLDIETMIDNNQHIPYLISYYDGNEARSFYLTDYNSSNNMIKACISDLMQPKYNKHKIYIHNLANFDSIFLLKNLVNFGELKVLLNKGKLISIDLTTDDTTQNDKQIELSFRDSYQILLASLKKLGKAFNVIHQKTSFDYDSVNKNNLELYRNEAIKYCENDCISLYEIVMKFNDMFFEKFDININEHPTLPGLAFRLFRTKYLKDSLIPMIFGDNYNKLKLSYTGGATDMYIPKNDWDNSLKPELVYAYDVNSLYPFVMANFPMPTGKIKYFEGDIRKIEPDAFGFFYCRIEVPSNLEHPILQTHVKTKSGLRTVAGIGTYHDMIFSHSMDTTIKAGYRIEILWGYSFEKNYIFKDYVNDLYKLRLDYDKSDPLNYIAKILLNSLYGKFGMRDNFDITKVINQAELDRLLNDKVTQISDVIDLDDKFLIQLKNQDNIIPDEFNSKDYNINVAIASAITSYARDFMSQFKNNPDLKLFYTDTDSIYTNLSPQEMNKLYPGIVSNSGLGKLKLEGIYKRAIFLAPKCYVLEDLEDNLTYKVKGLIKKVPLTFSDFESLLLRDSFIEKEQEKWHKNLSEGSINILKQSYTLKQTDNKRELIFNSLGKVITTKPYKITESKLISNKNNNKTFYIQNKFIVKCIFIDNGYCEIRTHDFFWKYSFSRRAP